MMFSPHHERDNSKTGFPPKISWSDEAYTMLSQTISSAMSEIAAQRIVDNLTVYHIDCAQK